MSARAEMPAHPTASEPPCRALFHGLREAEEGVRELGRQGVPADAIRVHVVDEDGTPTRELEVPKEAGTRRGALWGALGGGLLGLVLVLLVPLGGYGSVALDESPATLVAGALTVVAALAAAGVPLGAVLGMGRWRAGPRLTDRERATGSLLVTVRGAELAARAREILRRAGADELGSEAVSERAAGTAGGVA